MPRRRSAAPDLKELRARIDGWRAERRGRSMPSELWDAASVAAAQMGVSRVATALGLGYAPLKARVEASTGQQKPVAFVEWAGAQLLAAPPSTEMRFEIARGDARLTITAPNATCPSGERA